MNYPYHLGCHLKTGRLCRVPHPEFNAIPQGFVRIIWYREYEPLLPFKRIMRFRRNPYDENNELKPEYWSIVRWTDIQYELKEKRTGPFIAAILIGSMRNE